MAFAFETKDDNQYVQEYHRRDNSSSWFAPLLLLPIAFLAGWAVNGYMANGSLNQPLPEVGVGGGPENNVISPLPSEVTVSPLPTTSPTISPTRTPSESPTPGDTLIQ